MSKVTIQEWNAPAIQTRIRGAEETSVRKTLDQAAAAARGSRRTKSRSGKLRIQVFDVRRTADGVTGDFGYTEGYGMFHEIGFRGRAGDHTLRRAGDREFTRLAETLSAAAGL